MLVENTPRDDGEFVRNETVKTVDGRVGKVDGYQNGKWQVLFEDGSRGGFTSGQIKRTTILKG